MNRKPYGIVQRVLILAILQIGLLAGVQLVCPAKATGQTTDEIVAKILAARGGLEKVKAVQTEDRKSVV